VFFSSFIGINRTFSELFSFFCLVCGFVHQNIVCYSTSNQILVVFRDSTPDRAYWAPNTSMLLLVHGIWHQEINIAHTEVLDNLTQHRIRWRTSACQRTWRAEMNAKLGVQVSEGAEELDLVRIGLVREQDSHVGRDIVYEGV
jgi:hypothetical protein